MSEHFRALGSQILPLPSLFQLTPILRHLKQIIVSIWEPKWSTADEDRL